VKDLLVSRFHLVTGENSRVRRWSLYLFARYIEMPLLGGSTGFFGAGTGASVRTADIEHGDCPLFQAFPAPRDRVPFVRLASLPALLQRLDWLMTGSETEVYAKRDGLTHPVYGCNRIRRSEFHFGDILREGARAILTGGRSRWPFCRV
jgi:hypothetical protein